MLNPEKKHQFRQRLSVIHRKNIRNFNHVKTENEFEITDGAVIALPADAGDVLITASRDFTDFLFDSMNVSARIARAEESNILISIDESYGKYKSFKTNVSEVGIRITAHDERGAAQALFYLEDVITSSHSPFITFGTTERTPLFSPRMSHSGYMLDEFPDSHLAQIAHAGMDAILVMTTDSNASLWGYTDFNELIRRAAKWGIDVYAYSYFRSRCHPDDPNADAHYESTYGKLFRLCPGFKGVVLVGESVGFPTRDPDASPLPYNANFVDGIPSSKPSADFWPCKDYREWLIKLQSIIYKYNPDADIVFWSYNWGYADTEARKDLIRRLPKGISLLVTFESFEPLKYANGVYEQVYDYTLSYIGPGKYFISEAETAKEHGVRLYAMTNTGGNTWDMGGVPYEPMPSQWQKRAAAVMECREKYGLCGTMECHQYGFTPSIVSEMIKYMYDSGSTDVDDEMIKIIHRHFGFGNERAILDALEYWSMAIRELPPSAEEQCGAFRVGPSFPFSIEGKYMYPQDNCSKGYFMIPAYKPRNGHHQSSVTVSGVKMPFERARLVKMLYHLTEGRKRLEALGDINEEFERLVNLGKFMECIVTTGINAKDWYYVTARLPIASSREEVEDLISKAEVILENEHKNVERALPIVECDSRLGWDPRMEYVCDPERLRWKLRLLDYVITTELDKYRITNRFADNVSDN